VEAALPALMGAAVVAKYSAAGAVGCVISHGAAVPLDVIKTRVQLDPEKFAGQGFTENAKTLVAEEGVGVLLGGLGSTALGYSLHGGIKYGGFEALKYAIFHQGGVVALFAADHRLPALMMAGMTAEFAASLVLCPLEQTRIKMVSDPEYADGVLAAVIRLFSEGEGARGVLRSLPAIWTKTVPYTVGLYRLNPVYP
jgi:solute carrier family 25 phosphate transporter 3